MRRAFLLLFSLLAIASIGMAVFFPPQHNESQRQPRTTQVPQVSTRLPEPLRPTLPEIAQIPDNACNRLLIPDDVARSASSPSEMRERFEERARNLLRAYPPPAEIERGSAERKAVALTIDTGTGSNQGIEQLLAIAKHYRIEMTFFVTGCWAVENPELLQRIVAEGHSVANHTLTHRNLAKTTDDEAEREITETDRLIRETTGLTPVLFRKPLYAGGRRITDLAGRLEKLSVLGYPDFGDTTGWREGVTADDVRALVERKTAPGAIWVFHNLSLADLGAFEDIVRYHLTNGYAIVSVEELLLE